MNPVSAMTIAAYPWDQVINCPTCGYDYTHIKEAHARIGSDPAEWSPPLGVQVHGKTENRRSALVIQVTGECDHKWEIVFQQHKGQTFVHQKPCDQ